MNIYIVLFLFAILSMFFFLSNRSTIIIYLKPFMLPISCIIFLVLLITFPNTTVKSASSGLNLCLNVVFPSLFPFFVASELLSKTGFIKAIGVLFEPIMRPIFNVPGCGSFALLMGVTSGYPVGAKLTANMKEDKLVSKIEAERLLSFTNNSGPLFIVGAVAVGMFKMPSLGILLLSCHILASVTVGVLFRFYKYEKKNKKICRDTGIFDKFKSETVKNIRNAKLNPGEVLGDAIRNSISTMLSIGGFIILFSVIINLLFEIGFISSVSGLISLILTQFGIHRGIVSSLVGGFFEITTGTSMVSKVDAAFSQQIVAVSMILGWAGLSVHSQVYSIASKSDISIKPYLFGKFLQGILAAIYILLANKIMQLSLKSQSVFKIVDIEPSVTWYNYFILSCQYLLTLIIVMSIGVLFSFFHRQKN